MASFHITPYRFSGTVISPTDPIYSSLAQRLSENDDGVIRGFIPFYTGRFKHNPDPNDPIFDILVDRSDASNYSDWGRFTLTGLGVYSNADPSEFNELIVGEMITSLATVPGDAGDLPNDNEFDITLFQTEDQTGKWLVFFQGTLTFYLPLDSAAFGSCYIVTLKLERNLASGMILPEIRLVVRGPVSTGFASNRVPFNRLLTKSISEDIGKAILTIPASEIVLFAYFSKRSGSNYQLTLNYDLRDESSIAHHYVNLAYKLAYDLNETLKQQLTFIRRV